MDIKLYIMDLLSPVRDTYRKESAKLARPAPTLLALMGVCFVAPVHHGAAEDFSFQALCSLQQSLRDIGRPGSDV